MNDQRATKLQQTSDTIFTARAYAESAVQEIDYSGLILIDPEDPVVFREIVFAFWSHVQDEYQSHEEAASELLKELSKKTDRPMKLTAETKAAKKLKTKEK